jgi:hypothetical protein
VFRPYVVSVPNWMLTFEVAGGLIVYEATCTLFVVVTTPLAMIPTEADADFVVSTVLVTVTMAVPFCAVAGAV